MRPFGPSRFPAPFAPAFQFDPEPIGLPCDPPPCCCPGLTLLTLLPLLSLAALALLTLLTTLLTLTALALLPLLSALLALLSLLTLATALLTLLALLSLLAFTRLKHLPEVFQAGEALLHSHCPPLRPCRLRPAYRAPAVLPSTCRGLDQALRRNWTPTSPRTRPDRGGCSPALRCISRSISICCTSLSASRNLSGSGTLCGCLIARGGRSSPAPVS